MHIWMYSLIKSPCCVIYLKISSDLLHTTLFFVSTSYYIYLYFKTTFRFLRCILQKFNWNSAREYFRLSIAFNSLWWCAALQENISKRASPPKKRLFTFLLLLTNPIHLFCWSEPKKCSTYSIFWTSQNAFRHFML